MSVGLDVSALRGADDAWAHHDFTIQGSGSGWDALAEIPGATYLLDDAGLTVVDPRSDPMVGMSPGSEVTVDVVIPEPLPIGLLEVELAIPVWIDQGDADAAPDDTATVTLLYDVRDPSYLASVSGFCEVAVPVIDGRVPSLDELEQLDEAADLLPAAQRDAARDAIAVVAHDLDDEDPHTYSTFEAATAVGDICNLNLFGVAAMS